MMPNVVRGSRMAGLLVYLVGPGKRNEHEDPHLVAGDGPLMAWFDDEELDKGSAYAIARHLNEPHKAFGVDVPRGHVWHCSLSIRTDEGLLSDQRWGEIANDFIKLMEFDDVEGSKAPCRWAAVRHGVSQNGNDHVHLAVNLVREDGTKANVWNDFQRAQKAARALEAKYGLEQLEAQGQRATRGYSPAAREALARAQAQGKYDRSRNPGDPGWSDLAGEDRQARITAQMRIDQPTWALARKVRGAAAASRTEAEFVRRMRRAGLIARPRYAKGTTDVVTGYSVAERPKYGERPIWRGGGHLGRDLTLPRLREEWPDTPQEAMAAIAEWDAAARGKRPAAPGREMNEPSPEMWERYATEMAQLREDLRNVALDDQDTWARVARYSAGAFAAWSSAVEDEPGDLAAASDALAKSAQTYRAPSALKPKMTAMSGAAMLLASATQGGRGPVGQAVMLRQLVRLAQAVYDAAKANGELRRAGEIAAAERAHLREVAKRLPRLPKAAAPGTTSPTPAGEKKKAAEGKPLDPEVAEMLERIQAGQADANQALTSPSPANLEPHRPRVDSSPAHENER